MSASIADLKTLSLFRGLSPGELEMLSHHISVRQLPSGAEVFANGDPALSCFCILKGSIAVLVPNTTTNEVIATIPAGSPVGHMALVDGKRRSATCRVASAGASLVELTRDDFDRLFNSHSPLAYKILDNVVMDLVGRLRNTNQRLAEANRERSQTALRRKTRDAAEMLMGKGGFGDWAPDDLDPDSVEVQIPTLEQRMKDRNRR
ncbi:MAG: cyclic nucleotide-binding domain-containing protein [Myxococcota bacterium]|nr:cyclic nucleotide-binding domain-containing protein [Myxococcota bacterium]